MTISVRQEHINRGQRENSAHNPIVRAIESANRDVTAVVTKDRVHVYDAKRGTGYTYYATTEIRAWLDSWNKGLTVYPSMFYLP